MQALAHHKKSSALPMNSKRTSGMDAKKAEKHAGMKYTVYVCVCVCVCVQTSAHKLIGLFFKEFCFVLQ